MTAISSNCFSHDLQVVDALDYLRANFPTEAAKIDADFPEASHIIWHGSWFDTVAMRVDPDFSGWLCDAIEETGHVIWEEGEPWEADLETQVP